MQTDQDNLESLALRQKRFSITDNLSNFSDFLDFSKLMTFLQNGNPFPKYVAQAHQQ